MKSFYTIRTIAAINAKRFFRDRLAIFFTIAFPLIFLVIFGSLFGGNNSISFKVALINESSSPVATAFVEQAKTAEILKVDTAIANRDEANKKMLKKRARCHHCFASNFWRTR